MPIHFRVDKERRCVFLMGVPPFNDSDLVEYQQALAAHPDHGATFNQLADMRAVGHIALTHEGMMAGARLVSVYRDFLQGTKLAILVTEDGAFGMARVFAAYASEWLDVEVFRDEEAAHRWLGLDSEGEGVA